jgi:hypothetical protein
MKYPHTGLFEYCVQLGAALKATAVHDKIGFYIPKEYCSCFGAEANYYAYSPLHKIVPLRVPQVDVWHSTTASRFIKSHPKMKRVLSIHDLNFRYEKTSALKINKYLL